MKRLLAYKNWSLIKYVVAAILLCLIFVVANIPMTPWSLTIVFLGLLLVPGFLLAKIFKIGFKDDRFGEIILWATIGLVFSLALCFGGILSGVSLQLIVKIYPYLLIILFLLAAILDFFRKPQETVEYKIDWRDWKKLLTLENLLSLFLFSLIFIGLASITLKGSLFKGGDPNYHLSLMRKAYDSVSLAPANLSYIKSETSHIAYGLPVWHIFLALVARFHHTDMFAFWKTVSLPLSILGIGVWYWLALKIFKDRFFGALALIFFLIHIFNLNGGYYFSCLPLPDTLNTFLLFPLAIALGLKYIFDKETNYKPLLVMAAMVIFMAVIHLTQYFYFLMAVVVFGLVWLATQWKNPDYKSVLRRIFWVLASVCLIFLPFVGLLELKSHIISETFMKLMATTETRSLRYGLFLNWDVFFKYAYLSAPFLLLFLKKQPRLSFLVGLMLVTPLAYIPAISQILVKFLDYILVNRLLGSITWNFFLFAFVFGVLVLIVDKIITFLSETRGFISKKLNPKIWGIIVNGLLVLGTILFIEAQVDEGLGEKIYIWAFSDKTDILLDQYKFWILGIVLAITLVILVISWLRPKFAEFFEFKMPKNVLVPICMIAILMVIFTAETYDTLWGYVLTVQQRKLVTSRAEMDEFEKDTISGMGGQPMVDFIQNQVPADSVFMAPGSVLQTMPMFVNQFMAAYPHTAKSDRLAQLYDDSYTPEQKLGLVKEFGIQYIVLYNPGKQGEGYFAGYPQYYEKIFDNESRIYKVLPQAFADGQVQKTID